MLAACTDGTPEKPTITVTIEPLRYFAEQIGGDRFDVVTMVPNGASPETYEPTAQQMAALAKSELYIKAGNLGFERTWMKRLGANAQHLIVVDSSEGIEPLQVSKGSAADPHTWTSPANALRIAHNICKAMSRIDSKDSAYFRANLDSLTWKIIDLDARIAAGDNRRAIIEKYINPTHLTREMVEILIDSISVGRRIAGTREVPITIYWRF